MRIAINITKVAENNSLGYKLFVEELLQRVALEHPKNNFVVFSQLNSLQTNLNVSNSTSFILTHNLIEKFLEKINFFGRLAKEIKKNYTNHCISINDYKNPLPKGFSSLLLTPIHSKDSNSFFFSRLKKSHFQKIGVFSQVEKSALMEQGFSADKIITVSPAVATKWQLLSVEQKGATKESIANGKEYFVAPIYFSSEAEVLFVLKAFSAFKKRLKTNFKLVLLTEGKGPSENLSKKLNAYLFKEDVIIKYEQELPAYNQIFSSAYAAICLQERECMFALPLALQMGVPVISFDNELVKEICGEAAQFFTHDDQQALAERMMFLYKDEPKRALQIKAGVEMSNRYTWQKTVDAFSQLIG